MAQTSTVGTESTVAVRPIRPVLVWTTVGIAALLLQAYVYVAWLRDDAASVEPPTDITGATGFWVIAVQVGSTSAAVLTVLWVARKVRRERRVTVELALMLGYIACFWLDPVTPNYLRVTFYYSSGMVNLGSWGHHVPGWISPNSHLFVEPIFLTGAAYVWMVLTAKQGADVMRRVQRRRPQTGVGGLIFAGYLTVALIDFCLENLFVRTGVYAFPGTVHELSVAGGTTHQVPVYESLTWGLVWATGAAVLFFSNDRGETPLEKGADRFPPAGRHPGLVRVLAVTGCLNLAYVVLFALPYNLISLHIDPVPAGYADHLVNGICGPGTAHACPSPHLPMELPGAPVPPP